MTAHRPAWHERPLLGLLLSPFAWLGYLGLSALLVLVSAWVLDVVWWAQAGEPGLESMQDLLSADLATAQARALRQGVDPVWVTQLANGLYALFFERSGIDAMGWGFADAASLSIPDTVMRDVYLRHHLEIDAMRLGTQLLGVRLAVLLTSAPLVALLIGVGVVDGLCERAIRRDRGGRESASLYHRAKTLHGVLWVLGSAGMLVWPGAVPWRHLLPALALVSGMVARQQWAFYKKHV